MFICIYNRSQVSVYRTIGPLVYFILFYLFIYFVLVNGVKSDFALIVSGVSQGTILGPLFPSLYISVWNPHTKGPQEKLEEVHNRAARFVTRNYTLEERRMTVSLEQLKWEYLKKRRMDSRLILLYKGLKGKARITTDDLIPKSRRCKNNHSMAFKPPSASILAYKCSFFPLTIRDWNDSLTLCFPPLTYQIIVCPSSLSSYVLGTNCYPVRAPL